MREGEEGKWVWNGRKEGKKTHVKTRGHKFPTDGPDHEGHHSIRVKLE